MDFPLRKLSNEIKPILLLFFMTAYFPISLKFSVWAEETFSVDMEKKLILRYIFNFLFRCCRLFAD